MGDWPASENRGEEGCGSVRTRKFASDRVHGPAVGLKVVGFLGLFFGLIVVFKSAGDVALWMVFPKPGVLTDLVALNRDPILQGIVPASGGVTGGAMSAVVGLLIFIGAHHLHTFNSLGWARAAAWLAVVPFFSPCFFLGPPAGIWALLVLRNRAVQEQFVGGPGRDYNEGD